jgi:glutamate synthase domain-containing protein 2
MTLAKPNSSAATLTTTRSDVSPISGMCVTCIDGCSGPCEIGRSALRGREVIYPQPFGKVTSGSEKDYPIDYSHFNIQGTCVGAVGAEADPDKATFPAVDVTTAVGADGSIKMRVPVFTGALGSTEIARVHWEAMAAAAAIGGILVVVGENVCGMDPESEIQNGRVVRSPEMERRVNTYREWYDGWGGIVVQYNVEDGRLGVPEYVVEKLGVEIIEMKWGQGAKDIGGEVKLPTLERADLLKSRGYIVIPDPTQESKRDAFQRGSFREFERHSRLGMVEEEAFHREVERLRGIGAKYVTLKTGAYRPADLARAVKFASDSKIDLLTVDGAGGGTGMSPWRMMNEWGVPTVHLECLLYEYLDRLAKKGAYVPPAAIAGGISLEDHIFKGIALGAPYVKACCMGRATMAAAMVGNTYGKLMEERDYPDPEDYDEALLKIFTAAAPLKDRFGQDFKRISPGTIGMISYLDRLAAGLQQLMAGARKFALQYVDRGDLMALTREAADVSGIPYVMDADREEVDRILG